MVLVLAASSITILTPLAALVAVLGLVPMLAHRAGEGRARALARALGLEPGGAPSLAASAAIGLTAALIGLAASQPVFALEGRQIARTDAEVYVVVDTSASMLARRSPGAPTRIDRAKADALRIRSGLADVPVGVASFTDRVLPHLFPTPDSQVYAMTVERALRAENPPPDRTWATRATTLAALSALATRNFFSDTARSRAVVLLTDGETQEYSLPILASDLRGTPAVVPVIVHVSQEGERLYIGERIERGYARDPASEGALRELAAATDGVVLAEDDPAAIVSATRDALGRGEVAEVGARRSARPLAPWLLLATALPLGFLVARRIL